MKKLLLTTALLACCLTSLFAQPCLPEGITFTTQAEIDSFQINYPYCTEIEGDVGIGGDDITSLNGLNVLTSIDGNLYIGNAYFNSNLLLASLTGLENLSYIGGGLQISRNTALENLSGLENLNTVEGNLLIGGDITSWGNGGNPLLENISALGNLSTLIGNITIWNNGSLTSLFGLESLDSIGGFISILGNESLTNLSGLENLLSIEGFLSIGGNENLTSISGLNNIDAGSISGLFIFGNSSLSTCEVQSVCDYLESSYGTIEINNNAPGCNSPEEVEEACDNSCLPEGIEFTSQEQVDSFQINYPGCTEIEGDVHINGDDINNLNGLMVLTSIGGTLEIGHNEILTTLTGLDNLTSIGESLFIVHTDTLYSLTGLEGLTTIDSVLLVYGNNKLIDFTGLDNITTIGSNFHVDLNGALEDFHGLGNLISIGGDFLIGGINIAFWIGNPSLVDLSGLENLTTVGGELVIAGNYILNNLIALNNLNYIGENLRIFLNPSLADCDIQSICEYLASPNGLINIYDNAPGCNSPEEVEEACTQSVVEFSTINNLSIYPNPFNNSISIEFELKQPKTITINIYNHLGQQIELLSESRSVGQQKIEWDCKDLPAGIYFCVLKTNSGMQTTKMIKL